MGSSPERLVVGRIARPHGIRGETIVEVLTDFPHRFAPGSRLEAGDPSGPRRTLTVDSARAHAGRLLVAFREVADRTAAEALRGALLSIGAAEAAPPPEGTFYPHQIEGLAVVDEEGRPLGTLSRVLAGPANDLWVVETGGREVMVPAVGEFVRDVDLDAGRIVLHVVPGLFE